MVLMLDDTVFTLFATDVTFVETVAILVDTFVRLVETVFILPSATAAVAASVIVTLPRLVMLVDRVVMLVVKVVELVDRVLALVVNEVLVSVNEVAASLTFVQLVCKLPGSIKLTPRLTNSMEALFDGSEAESMAGLKNGAVAGSFTATPVLPIAIDRGSNVLNGSARALLAHNISTKTADSRAYILRIASLFGSPDSSRSSMH